MIQEHLEDQREMFVADVEETKSNEEEQQQPVDEVETITTMHLPLIHWFNSGLGILTSLTSDIPLEELFSNI